MVSLYYVYRYISCFLDWLQSETLLFLSNFYNFASIVKFLLLLTNSIFFLSYVSNRAIRIRLAAGIVYKLALGHIDKNVV